MINLEHSSRIKPMDETEVSTSGLNIRQLISHGALRWLHSIDLDPTSKTYGVCDREFWAWKTKDFPNGTWQGGLAGFLDAQQYLILSDDEQRAVVEAVLHGTRSIQRRDGSFEEAYPFESSYCVTALVQFNLLYCALKYPQKFSTRVEKDLRSILLKSNVFLRNTPETHGVIANHQATALMARHLAARYLNQSLPQSEYERFARLQHPAEGWLPEYGLADPGYQTLLNHYLAVAHSVAPLPDNLRELLENSQRFVSHFCLPDGSFAGEIGGRGTSVVYPGGIVPKSGASAIDLMRNWFLNLYAKSYHAVTPLTVDAGSFVPVFNSWAFATIECADPQNTPDGSSPRLPKIPIPPRLIEFPAAGLFRFQSDEAVAIVSSKSSAIRRVIRQDNGKWQDGSLVALNDGRRTTQGGKVCDFTITEKLCTFQVSPVVRNQQLNTPFRAIVLRAMALCLHRWPAMHRGVKKMLANFVMGRSKNARGNLISISIDLTHPELPISVDSPNNHWQRLSYGYHQHMASANTFEMRSLRTEGKE